MSETFSEFRKRERREAKEAERVATAAKRLADSDAARERAQAAKEREIQLQYVHYLNHQWNAGQDDEKLCSRRRWFELTAGTRRIVLDAIAQNPRLRISGL